MKVIYKYPITNNSQEIEILGLVKILKAEEQENDLVIWCIVDTEDKEKYLLVTSIFGTGERDEDGDKMIPTNYLNTINTKTGFVWHVFTTVLKKTKN